MDKTETTTEEAGSQESVVDLETRLHRLEALGKVDSLTVLKLRLDLVTQLLVPDSLVQQLNTAWIELLTRYVEQLEQEPRLYVPAQEGQRK